MNQRQREWNVFGHELTTSELSIYVIMVVTLIGGVASILIGIASIFVAIAVSLASILFLLLGFVWYQVTATRQLQMSLEEGKIEIIKRPDDILLRSISTLERGRMQGGWEKVRIYESPVGFCDPSPAKDEWLHALKSALERGDAQNYSGVYALPPDRSSFETYARKRLELFENTPNTRMHYLPPEDGTHPTPAAGLGMIVFVDPDNERYEVIFDFIGEVTNGPMLRSGFAVHDQRVGRMVAEWFDSQIFHDKSRTYVLRGMRPGKGQVNFEEEMARIEQQYYTSPVTTGAPTKPEEGKTL